MKYIKYIREYKEIDWNDWEEIQDEIPDEFEGHEKFYNFLVDNNCFDEWVDEARKRINII